MKGKCEAMVELTAGGFLLIFPAFQKAPCAGITLIRLYGYDLSLAFLEG
jgi:hypothetical protein